MWRKRFDLKFTTEFNGRKILYYDFDRDRNLIEPEVIKEFIAEELKIRDKQWEKLLQDGVILTKGGTYLLEYDFIKKIKAKLNETNKNNSTALCDVAKKDHKR